MTTRREPSSGSSSDGPSVDSWGTPVVDPTDNVIALNAASEARQNDLRKSDIIYTEAQLRNIRAEMKLRAAHAAEIRKLDAANQKAIRLVDITNAKAQAAQVAVAVLALETKRQADADNLRTALNAANASSDKRVSDLAATLAEQKTVSDRGFTDQIAALQRSTTLGEGRQTYTDPVQAEMLRKIEALSHTSTAQTSSGEGMSKLLAIMLAVGGVVIAAVTLIVKMNA